MMPCFSTCCRWAGSYQPHRDYLWRSSAKISASMFRLLRHCNRLSILYCLFSDAPPCLTEDKTLRLTTRIFPTQENQDSQQKHDLPLVRRHRLGCCEVLRRDVPEQRSGGDPSRAWRLSFGQTG